MARGFPERQKLRQHTAGPGNPEIPEEIIFNEPIRDLHTTLLHQLGLNHEMPRYKFQGLDQHLTGVEPVKVISDILA